MLIKPKALVIVGHGINCDRELESAFRIAGADVEHKHLNELTKFSNIDVKRYQIIAFPGGFSFGDDTFAGNIFAKQVKYSPLRDALGKHLDQGKLIIGICNGNQIGTMLNLVPIFGDYFSEPEVAFTYNNSARYEDRGNIHLKVVSDLSVWLENIDILHNIPVGHGEGKFFTKPKVLERMYKEGLIALKYINEDGNPAHGKYPINPNGSIDDIAGIASEQVLLLMPHPERSITGYNQDGWTRRKSLLKREGKKLVEEGDGMKIIRNGVDYAKQLI
jgi:phosphoribosylformylglycinamidine synthase subunit PurQ / glutaminase